MSVTVDQVIAAYISTRDEIERRTKELEAELAPLKAYQEAREQFLDAEMRKQGETSKKTPHGTCFYKVTESVSVADWDGLWEFITQNNRYELLQHAVNKTAALELMGEDRGNPAPPGVNYVAIRKVHVRRK